MLTGDTGVSDVVITTGAQVECAEQAMLSKNSSTSRQKCIIYGLNNECADKEWEYKKE